MGCSVLCEVLQEFATFLQWIVEKKKGLSTIDHYLDDFIFAGEDFDTYQKLMDLSNMNYGFYWQRINLLFQHIISHF